jgi:hypothetical protein
LTWLYTNSFSNGGQQNRELNRDKNRINIINKRANMNIIKEALFVKTDHEFADAMQQQWKKRERERYREIENK